MAKEHINGYALALISIAEEEKKLIKYKKDAETIVEALMGNEEILHILRTRSIELKDKKLIIDKAFKGITVAIKNFISLTSEKGTATIVKPVLESFIKYANEKLGIKEGVIYSAEKLKPAEISGIEKRVSKNLGFTPTLRNKIDTELLSGIKIVVGDEVIEDSVASRLEQIKYELLREGN